MWRNGRAFICDPNFQKVAGSNLGRSASSEHPCASVTKHYYLVPADVQWRYLAGKVTAGLVESNGSLPAGGWLKVTCGLTDCTPGSALGQTVGNEYGIIILCLYLFLHCAQLEKIVWTIEWLSLLLWRPRSPSSDDTNRQMRTSEADTNVSTSSLLWWLA